MLKKHKRYSHQQGNGRRSLESHARKEAWTHLLHIRHRVWPTQIHSGWVGVDKELKFLYALFEAPNGGRVESVDEWVGITGAVWSDVWYVGPVFLLLEWLSHFGQLVFH